MYIVIIIIRIYFKSNNLLNTTFTFLAQKYNLLGILNLSNKNKELKNVFGGEITKTVIIMDL